MFKSLDFVNHIKGGRYIFLAVVHPSSEIPPLSMLHYRQNAFHTELEKDVTIVSNSNGTAPVYYSADIDEYMVLYTPVYDGGNPMGMNKNYVRPIQMFFEHAKDPKTGEFKHRFTKEEKWSGQ